jgi:transcriptional regulator with XRE-family HTH domain
VAKKRKRGPAVGRPRTRPAVTPFMAALGECIRARREDELGMSLRQAADRTFGMVGFQQWSAYEQGKNEPRLATFLAICVALGCRADQLLPAELAAKMDPAGPLGAAAAVDCLREGRGEAQG